MRPLLVGGVVANGDAAANDGEAGVPVRGGRDGSTIVTLGHSARGVPTFLGTAFIGPGVTSAVTMGSSIISTVFSLALVNVAGSRVAAVLHGFNMYTNTVGAWGRGTMFLVQGKYNTVVTLLSQQCTLVTPGNVVNPGPAACRVSQANLTNSPSVLFPMITHGAFVGSDNTRVGRMLEYKFDGSVILMPGAYVGALNVGSTGGSTPTSVQSFTWSEVPLASVAVQTGGVTVS